MAPGPIGIQPAICINPGHDATMKGSDPSFSHWISLQPERSRMDASVSSELALYKLGVSSMLKVSVSYELVGYIVQSSKGADIMGRGSMLVGKDIYNDIVH